MLDMKYYRPLTKSRRFRGHLFLKNITTCDDILQPSDKVTALAKELPEPRFF